MCGVIGAKFINTTDDQIGLLKRVFEETQIRGKHACGVSWFNGKDLSTIKESITSKEFVKKYDIRDFKNGSDLTLIGHIRYSTSDLEWNQPIADKEMSIVHNGVVTQESPEKWEEHFGLTCVGKNDSELLFQALKNNESIFEKFSELSASILVLKGNEIINIRNGYRPQWKCTFENGFIIASTRDILLRAGCLIENIQKIQPEPGQEEHINA